MLPEAAADVLDSIMSNSRAITFETQVGIEILSSRKIPDLVVFADGKAICVFEVKINAAEQTHVSEVEYDGTRPRTDQAQTQGQLQTYADWIGSQRLGKWPGALIFLTHITVAPLGFENHSMTGRRPVCSVRSWRDVAIWLETVIGASKDSFDYNALCRDFITFLAELGLMTEYITSKDMAATELFLPSYAVLKHTMSRVTTVLSDSQPQLRGGRFHFDLDSELGICWDWFYTNRKLNPGKRRLYFSFGVCFAGAGSFAAEDKDKLPQHGQYFFLLFADDWGNSIFPEVLESIPSDWILLSEGIEVIAYLPLRKVSSDPDVRVMEVTEWAKGALEKLTACIKNFSAAPVEKVIEEDDA